MGVTSFDWGPRLQNEALKCWFYSISFSLVLGYYQYIMLYFSPPKASKPASSTDEKANDEKDSTNASPSEEDLARAEELSAAQSKITTQLIIDHCDIFLPGSAVGWIPAGPIGVGTCQSISSVFAMRSVWEKMPADG